MDVSVCELKDHLSEHLNCASTGEEVVITSYGKVITRLAPLKIDDRRSRY